MVDRPNLGRIMDFVSDAANTVALVFFGLSFWYLCSQAERQWAAGGTIPQPTSEMFRSVVENPASVYGWWHFGVAWLLAIGACGCGWMTILGCRWLWLTLRARISS